jgi:hypothetical protein
LVTTIPLKGGTTALNPMCGTAAVLLVRNTLRKGRVIEELAWVTDKLQRVRDSSISEMSSKLWLDFFFLSFPVESYPLIFAGKVPPPREVKLVKLY